MTDAPPRIYVPAFGHHHHTYIWPGGHYTHTIRPAVDADVPASSSTPKVVDTDPGHVPH